MPIFHLYMIYVYFSFYVNQNYIQREYESVLNSWNALHHSGQNKGSNPLSEQGKMKIEINVISPVIHHGYET